MQAESLAPEHAAHGGSEERIGVDVDLDADTSGGADLGQPAAQDGLQVDLEAGAEEQAAAMAAPQEGERRRRRAQGLDALAGRRGATERDGGGIDPLGVAAADDQRGEASRSPLISAVITGWAGW
jgi:hypothetical protein